RAGDIAGTRSPALGRVPRHSTTSPGPDTQVRAATHSSIVRLIAFIEKCIGKQTAPTRLALFLPLCSAEGSDERALRRSQSRASTEAIGREFMKSLTSIRWHRILRAHHQRTAFQSIRYALWLMR